jgi:hypothetical protein
VWPEGLGKLIKIIHLISSRTHDLPVTTIYRISFSKPSACINVTKKYVHGDILRAEIKINVLYYVLQQDQKKYQNMHVSEDTLILLANLEITTPAAKLYQSSASFTLWYFL